MIDETNFKQCVECRAQVLNGAQSTVAGRELTVQDVVDLNPIGIPRVSEMHRDSIRRSI